MNMQIGFVLLTQPELPRAHVSVRDNLNQRVQFNPSPDALSADQHLEERLPRMLCLKAKGMQLLSPVVVQFLALCVFCFLESADVLPFAWLVIGWKFIFLVEVLFVIADKYG